MRRSPVGKSGVLLTLGSWPKESMDQAKHPADSPTATPGHRLEPEAELTCLRQFS